MDARAIDLIYPNLLISCAYKARVKRRASHEPNRMLMRENKGFFSFAFHSAHVKYRFDPGLRRRSKRDSSDLKCL